MTWWLITLEIFYVTLVIFTSYRIIVDTRSSAKTLAYLLAVVFLPFIGVIIYFSVGINYKKRQIYSKKVTSSNTLQSIVYTMHERSIQSYKDEIVKELDTRIPQFLFQSNKNPLTSNNKVEILKNGEEKFPKALQAIANAKQTIHIEYYIMEDGEVTSLLEKLLIQKAKEGVKIRIIYDDFGSSS
ncbi:MAG TPA: PLDc N-terminal domain-containing protein, partial [Brumimicrobium sp.]|nr:PLDc N-terminal domain-containing protein [Brumimicrobium sp.]